MDFHRVQTAAVAGTRSGSLSQAALAAAALALAGGYLFSALLAIWQLGFSELFSDQFRQYRNLIDGPFLLAIFRPDNGHLQAISNLLRGLDIRLSGGDQTILIVFGLSMLLLTLGSVVRIAWGDRSRLSLPAAVLAATLWLCWLGAGRMQFHGNEMAQVYLILFCCVAALWLVERLGPRGSGWELLVVLIPCAIAMLTFGTGVATFPAVVALAAIRRVSLSRLIPLAVAAVACMLLYLLLSLRSGLSSRATPALADLASDATLWLSSFWMSAWLALGRSGLMGNPEDQVPPIFHLDDLQHSADWIRAALGLTNDQVLGSALGALGLIVLLLLCLRAWRRPKTVGTLESVALGIALFVAATAAMVALGRNDYFRIHPDQVLADRYVIWSQTFWFALVLALVARLGRGRWGSVAAKTVAIALALLLLPTHLAAIGWASAAERAMEQRAAQAQTGAVLAGYAQHADLPDDSAAPQAIDYYRTQSLGPFRTARSRMMGSRLERAAPLDAQPEGLADLRVERLHQPAADGQGTWHIEGRLAIGTPRHAIDGIVIVDQERRVIGLGEFGFGPRSRLGRMDRVADGFDAYVRTTPDDCSGSSVIGWDDSATVQVLLATLENCP